MFETLLTKSSEQIINNLLLSNLLGRSYVSIETTDSGHHSPTPGGVEDHHDNHTEQGQGHSNDTQGSSTEGEDHVKTNAENTDLSKSSSSTETENKNNSSQNGQTCGQTDSKDPKSELLNDGANGEESSPKVKTSEVSAETSEKRDAEQNLTKSKDNGELSKVDAELSKKDAELPKKDAESTGDAGTHRQRHHSDFESELDEILGRVSSSGSGAGDAAESDSSSTNQKSSSLEEEQLVSHQGNCFQVILAEDVTFLSQNLEFEKGSLYNIVGIDGEF